MKSVWISSMEHLRILRYYNKNRAFKMICHKKAINVYISVCSKLNSTEVGLTFVIFVRHSNITITFIWRALFDYLRLEFVCLKPDTGLKSELARASNHVEGFKQAKREP